MSEGKEATIDEILEADNLDFEPDEDEMLDEDDNENLSEESDESDSDNSDKDKPVKDETTAKQTNDDELIKKTFGDDADAEKVRKFAKQMVGDVNIEDLSERELNLLKTNYHAQKKITEEAQKRAEAEKSKEAEQSQKAAQEIEQLDVKLQEDYQKAREAISQSESRDKALLRKCLEESTPIKWYDGKEYPVTEETYEFLKDEIIRNHTALSKDLDIEINQKRQENKVKQAEQSKTKTEQFFNDFSAKPEIVERLEKTPELKEVVEFLKANAQPDEEFTNQVLDKFEGLIDTAAKRIAAKEKISSEINADKNKAASLGNGVSKTKKGEIQTLDDILNASLDEL